LYWRLSRNWHARLQLRNQWRINRSDSSSGSSKLQKIGASPKGDGFRTIPKSASSVFSMRALKDGKQPTFWNRTIPSEAVSYGGNPLTNKARSGNVEGMVNQALYAVCELIDFSLTLRSAGWRRVT
jgi:hypothetical protein